MYLPFFFAIYSSYIYIFLNSNSSISVTIWNSTNTLMNFSQNDRKLPLTLYILFSLIVF
jgi:hypothetical protein